MLSELRIGLQEQRVIDLFNLFDTDCGGSVSCMDFVHLLFPLEYHRILRERMDETTEGFAGFRSEKTDTSGLACKGTQSTRRSPSSSSGLNLALRVPPRTEKKLDLQ